MEVIRQPFKRLLHKIATGSSEIYEAWRMARSQAEGATVTPMTRWTKRDLTKARRIAETMLPTTYEYPQIHAELINQVEPSTSDGEECETPKHAQTGNKGLSTLSGMQFVSTKKLKLRTMEHYYSTKGQQRKQWSNETSANETLDKHITKERWTHDDKSEGRGPGRTGQG
jgi:hypothetical protein